MGHIWWWDKFTRQAANNNENIWSSINTSLFSLLYRQCLNQQGMWVLLHHSPQEQLLQMSPAGRWRGNITAPAWPRCHRFNEDHCNIFLLDCSYWHVYTRCRGRYPVVSCKEGLERGSPNQSKQKDSFWQQPY